MNGRRILIVSPTPTHPRGAGNRARIETMMQSLIEAGHKVTLLHVEREDGDREAMKAAWGEGYQHADYRAPRTPGQRLRKKLSRLLDADGVQNYKIDDWYDPQLDPVLDDLQRSQSFDAVIVEYVFMSRALLRFGDGVRKLIDTHDMFTDRHQRYLDQGQKPQWYSTTAAEESRGFDRADTVMAITDKERDVFAAMTRTPVITVGHFIACEGRDPALVKPGSLLFVASDNPINLHGLNWFLDQVFPQLQALHPSLEVWLVGTIARQIDARPGVVKMGRIDDLSQVYRQAHVVINPVRFNTGLSIKNLEAMAFSCPLVTCVPVGDRPATGADAAFLTADRPEEFVRAVDRVLTDQVLAADLGNQARMVVDAWNRRGLLDLNRALVGEDRDHQVQPLRSEALDGSK